MCSVILCMVDVNVNMPSTSMYFGTRLAQGSRLDHFCAAEGNSTSNTYPQEKLCQICVSCLNVFVTVCFTIPRHVSTCGIRARRVEKCWGKNVEGDCRRDLL